MSGIRGRYTPVVQLLLRQQLMLLSISRREISSVGTEYDTCVFRVPIYHRDWFVNGESETISISTHAAVLGHLDVDEWRRATTNYFTCNRVTIPTGIYYDLITSQLYLSRTRRVEELSHQ